ncbi:MAG TPA: hypothetical protein VK558_08040 [Patescibacteria group bacterium]|nr:hypothetical protein [Patescibacteria group bacterium]
MTNAKGKRGFATRPGDAESWVKAPKSPSRSASDFTARLTIDITPSLRGRIKIAAFQRGLTVADMLRDLLAREFPDSQGETP